MDAILGVEIYGNALGAWLTAIAIALVINVSVALVKWAIFNRITEVVMRAGKTASDIVLGMSRSTRQSLVFVVALFAGVQYLDLPETAATVLKAAATLALFVQVGLWGGSALDVWIERSRARAIAAESGAATTLGILSFMGKVVLWSLVLLLALDNMGVNVTAMVAGLGVGGIAVALALQNVLGDLFASLSIVIDKPFVVGDFIIVDDYMGTIENVGLKTTRIRSLGGEQIVFANSDLLKTRIRNYKRMRERRCVFAFGVLYQTRPDQLERIPATVKRIVEQQKLARFDRAHFKSFGSSSLDFEVVYWMTEPDYNKYMDTQQAINLAIVRAFEKDGVSMAFPTRTLHIEGPVQVANVAAARAAPKPQRELEEA